jgi:hypothetical protein
MKLLVIALLAVGVSSCKFNDDIRLETAITYSKTLRLIAPKSVYFEIFKKAYSDGVIDSNDFINLQIIYKKHLVEHEIREALKEQE